MSHQSVSTPFSPTDREEAHGEFFAIREKIAKVSDELGHIAVVSMDRTISPQLSQLVTTLDETAGAVSHVLTAAHDRRAAAYASQRETPVVSSGSGPSPEVESERDHDSRLSDVLNGEYPRSAVIIDWPHDGTPQGVYHHPGVEPSIAPRLRAKMIRDDAMGAT